MKKSMLLAISLPIILSIATVASGGPIPAGRGLLPSYVEAPAKIPQLTAASSAFEKGQTDESLQHLRAAVQKHPNLPPARLMLARLYFAHNQAAKGRATLEQVAINYPGHPEVYLLFARLALAENRITDAQLHLDKAAAVAVPDSWPEAQKAKLQIEFHAGRATIAERRRDWNTAAEALAAWLEHDPAKAEVRERYARVLFFAGKSKEAYQQLTAAFAKDPTTEPPEVSMGAFCVAQGDHEKAESWLQRALKEYPENPKSHVEFASYLLLHGRATEAKTHLDRANTLGHANPTKTKTLGGIAARQLGSYDEAKHLFEAILLESPSNFDAANQLALTLIETSGVDDRGKARQLAEMNVRQYPKLPAALATLGWVYYRSNRAVDAERMLRAAAAGGQIPLDATYYLARVLTERGQPEEAKKAQDLLKMSAAKPGLFVVRDEAKQWLAKQ